MAIRLPSPPRRRPVVVALAAAVAALVLLGGCATFELLDDMGQRLEAKGFRDVDVRVDERTLSDLVVVADAPRGTSAREGQAQAAEVVWDTFPRRFDILRTEIDGRDQRWTYPELEERFGDRPDRLDRRELEADWNRFVVVTALAVLVVGVVGLGGLGVVLVLVRRSSRRRTAPTPPTRPWMPPGHGPVPPPGGWTPAPGVSLTEEDGAPAQGAPAPAPPTPTPTPPASWTGDGPRWPPLPTSPRRQRDEDRRLGRRPTGPRPDADHTPPGWG